MSKSKAPCGSFYLGDGIIKNPNNIHELMVDPDYIKEEDNFKWYHIINDGPNLVIQEENGGEEICNHIHDGKYVIQLVNIGYEVYTYFGRDALNRPQFYCLVPKIIDGYWHLRIKIAYINTDSNHYVTIVEDAITNG